MMNLTIESEEDTNEEELEHDQYVVFAVRSQEYGIQAIRVQEISALLATTKVPSAPPYIEGIMNLRGRLASVFNFRRKFGFEPKEHDEDTRIIVVELEQYPIGIIVDSVEEVIKIPDEIVQKMPESTITSQSQEYMTGIGMLDSRLIILLDVDRLLTSTELIELGHVERMMDEIAKAPEGKAAETKVEPQRGAAEEGTGPVRDDECDRKAAGAQVSLQRGESEPMAPVARAQSARKRASPIETSVTGEDEDAPCESESGSEGAGTSVHRTRKRAKSIKPVGVNRIADTADELAAPAGDRQAGAEPSANTTKRRAKRRKA